MVCQYLEAQGLEGHFYTLQREIEQFRPQRLVLDSVSALERVVNVRHFREFVIGLTSFVEQKPIRSQFTSSSPRSRAATRSRTLTSRPSPTRSCSCATSSGTGS
jgi:circadian clock protein KaiC